MWVCSARFGSQKEKKMCQQQTVVYYTNVLSSHNNISSTIIFDCFIFIIDSINLWWEKFWNAWLNAQWFENDTSFVCFNGTESKIYYAKEDREENAPEETRPDTYYCMQCMVVGVWHSAFVPLYFLHGKACVSPDPFMTANGLFSTYYLLYYEHIQPAMSFLISR